MLQLIESYDLNHSSLKHQKSLQSGQTLLTLWTKYRRRGSFNLKYGR